MLNISFSRRKGIGCNMFQAFQLKEMCDSHNIAKFILGLKSTNFITLGKK